MNDAKVEEMFLFLENDIQIEITNNNYSYV